MQSWKIEYGEIGISQPKGHTNGEEPELQAFSARQNCGDQKCSRISPAEKIIGMLAGSTFKVNGDAWATRTGN